MTGAVSTNRWENVDVVRGFVIALMALDHIRAYWGPTPFEVLDLSQTSFAWFMTRWITHLCAPTFIFLAGVSVYFQLAKSNDKKAVSQHLLMRGLWLILLEVVVVNASWKGVLSFDHLWLQVIWAIGISMVICSALIWLPVSLIAVSAIAMVAGHDLLNHFIPSESMTWLWYVIHQRGGFEIFNSGSELYIAYPLLPWPGVMLLGYLLGRLYVNNPQHVVRWCSILGVASLCLFVLLRGWIQYGDPELYVQQPTLLYSFLSFLNVHKYPASLQYVAVTLGLCLLLLAFAQRFRFYGKDALSTFGKVALFFYLLHIPVIHISSYLWLTLSYGETVNMLLASSTSWPAGYEPALWRVYLVWVVLLVGLYYLCKRYWQLKSERRDVWILRWV